MESADLVAAKLRAPVSLAPLLPRPRISALLDKAAAESTVVLLIGPSGSGKTAALSQWSTGAWITLDAQDNDPIQFWRYVAQAIGAPGNSHPPGSDAFVAELASGIAPGTGLVLDEFEHVVARGIHRQLDLLVSAGNDLTLVIGSRVRPPLRLDRLLLAGRLTSLSWTDLRFSPEEAELLGRRVVDSDGWPASVALQGRETDYLVEHVWAELAAGLGEFLLVAAVPARFDVALMNAVRGTSDSDVLIDRLRRDEVFLISDDGRGRWYRLQRSFREALLHRLETTAPDRLVAVRRAAARWHATSGDQEEAIGLALAAGDFSSAVRLLDDGLDVLYRDGRLVSLEQWLVALPDTALADSGLGRRALSLWCELGRFSERDRWIDATPSARAIGSDEVWRLCLPRERGDLTLALRQGRQLLATALPSPQSASQARISVARTLLLAGFYAESAALASEIPPLWSGEPPAPVRVALHGLRGLAAFLQLDAEVQEEAAAVRAALHECQVRPSARMMPEAMILLALDSADPAGELARLVDESGYGNDLTMGAFATLLLARQLGGTEAQVRLAAADALLTGCPSLLGLVDFRDRIAAEIGAPVSAATSVGETLSERELIVLQYLRSELTLREIAEDLFLSLNTVKTHARNIYRKLDVSGRHELSR
ncbi:regulatory LuxR family protein [Kribbella orskensis]|uniref:Regulatory LuxR family protein n=1 Tax=Kribbella orskensis TaxID=2512216 RepID=A0ABY2BMZ8_9ACTN|nr:MULTISPECIES: LuxR C-terminal-related transcriptional regulator [Kribbella]TCN41192.1 regulatory LuxR family protein [Kribbella sp. VKM Ac-2500]TCO24444.1 regulatory LuxR family protein [Kribbella orskensis]